MPTRLFLLMSTVRRVWPSGQVVEMSEEVLQRRIVQVLNEEIGSDLKHLSHIKKLHDETKAIQSTLREKLSLISSEAPTKVQTALKDVEDFSAKLDSLQAQFLVVKDSEKTVFNGTDQFLEELERRLEVVDKFEMQKTYLQCIQIVESTSDKLQLCVQSNQDTEAVDLYNEIVALYCRVESSKCLHFVSFVDQTVVFWFELLKEKICKELQESLKMIQWPFISSNQEVLHTPPSQEVMSKFQQQFQCLSKLAIPLKHKDTYVKSRDDHPILSRFPVVSQSIEELIQPLAKRFSYHFSGNRRTNRLDKPEWFLRQILQFMKDHEKFIEAKIQPIYNSNNAMLEFSTGLVYLAVEKLVKDSAAILADDAILAKTIGEVLSFETELRTMHNYPSSQPSALLLLTQPVFYNRWLALEKALAVEKMDCLLSHERAWACVTTFDNSDTDDGVCLTECGEGFLQMLLAMTDRYKTLPQPGHRLRFLDLQLELLDEFRIRLLQLARQDKFHDMFDKTCPNICTILNTVAAVINVLNDWADLPFFLQLHSYKVQTESMERQAAQVLEGSESTLLPWLRNQTQNLTWNAEEGSVFDAVIGLLKRMQETFIVKVVEAVMLEVKATSQPYRLDKWAALPSQDAFIQPSLSPTGSALLQAIAFGIQWLQDSLAPPLYRESWQKLALQVNQFLFEELILQRQFNDGGTAQLCFDIQQNLIPLFSQLTSKPESYFRELKDACTLLSLPRPIILLLLDTLSQAVLLADDSVKNSRLISNGKQALKDQGVCKLSMEESLSVLRRRIL